MKWLRIIANKYLLTAVAFAAWMFFFDRNDFFTQRDRRESLEETKENIEYLRAEIAVMERDYQEIRNNPKKLEQYARERYRMKRDNEDVYVVEP